MAPRPQINEGEQCVSFPEAGSQPGATLLPSRHCTMSLDICRCHARMLLASLPHSAQDGPPQRLPLPDISSASPRAPPRSVTNTQPWMNVSNRFATSKNQTCSLAPARPCVLAAEISPQPG